MTPGAPQAAPAGVVNETRRMMLAGTELYWDEHCVVDSLPVPVVEFHLAPQSRIRWSDWGADYGPVPSRKIMIRGYKLHMLITLGGLIIDFELAPASQLDLAVGRELLAEREYRIVIGDKACVIAPAAEDLWLYNRIRLLTKPRKDRKKQLPARVSRLYDSVRQMIETVTSQLEAQFSFETNRAHTLWGLCARLYTKLTAHTLCVYVNRLLGAPDYLIINQLAFHN